MTQPSPVAAAKALKNAAELAGMREAHLRDAVALAETFSWLEQQARATLPYPNPRGCSRGVSASALPSTPSRQAMRLLKRMWL